jgi:hypothetical protein
VKEQIQRDQKWKPSQHASDSVYDNLTQFPATRKFLVLRIALVPSDLSIAKAANI